MTHVHLATGLALRGGGVSEGGERCVLLVASHYANHADALWNLPGGRQQPGELLSETVAREVSEETGIGVRVGALAYVSESYDGDVHFINATFLVEVADAEAVLAVPGTGDHVAEAQWVPVAEIASCVTIGVVREPLLAFLRGELAGRYAGFHEAGVTIQWPNDPA